MRNYQSFSQVRAVAFNQVLRELKTGALMEVRDEIKGVGMSDTNIRHTYEMVLRYCGPTPILDSLLSKKISELIEFRGWD